jgi:hypothetical protein
MMAEVAKIDGWHRVCELKTSLIESLAEKFNVRTFEKLLILESEISHLLKSIRTFQKCLKSH